MRIKALYMDGIEFDKEVLDIAIQGEVLIVRETKMLDSILPLRHIRCLEVDKTTPTVVKPDFGGKAS